MKIISTFVILLCFFSFTACVKNPPPAKPATSFSADVAVAWMNLNIRLTMITPGFNSVVSDRSFSYAGLTLYESIAPGYPGHSSLMGCLNGAPALSSPGHVPLYWPASANAAMAAITRDMFGNASAAGLYSIDSLESLFASKFDGKAPSEEITGAVDFGRAVAATIFDYSKTDGGDQAYAHVTDPAYIWPVGPGHWVPTPPLFGAPIHPHWGTNRTFVAGDADETQPGPPMTYSEKPGSGFYEMVNQLYTISLSLTHEDSTIAKFWADIPGNDNVPAHATNIVNQLVVLNKTDLGTAAWIYAKHGIAMYDASISDFRAKYEYTLIRPVSYIRTVMGHPDWNTVVPTPPHPEYTAAHAVISGASAAILEDVFGSGYHFTDRTYESKFGARSFNSFDDYAKEAGHSRLLGGLHYGPSIQKGLDQGKKIGLIVAQFCGHKGK